MARRYLVATTNPGKAREIRRLLEGLPLELVELDRYPGVPPPEETGRTFAENARLKALYYAHATGLPAIAEDSGLEIDALDGRPGVESARYCGPDATYPERFGQLYRELDRRGSPESPARFVCHVCLVGGDRVLFEARGTVEGRIARAPRGEGGFGYDPIFFYPPLGATLAEVGDRKAAVSHRGQAFRQLAEFLKHSV